MHFSCNIITRRHFKAGILVITLVLIAGPNTFTHAQDSRGITQSKLQQFYRQTKKTANFTNRNGIPSPTNYNTPVTTYVAASQGTRALPLAVPITFGLGEPERKDTMRDAGNDRRNSFKLTEEQRSQLWRYKLIPGTDKHLKQIFAGRCWDYQNKFKLQQSVDCKKLWKAFLAGFTYKQPCDVTLEDYKDFFAMIHEDPLINKSMLWTGSAEITHELSSLNARFTALEDTFAGYLLDGKQWCGMVEKPGINYDNCPYECAKQKAFWGAAAKKMAERSEGLVYAVINGTRQHLVDKQIFSAYMMDSYMARNQIPNLNPRKVTEVRILVGHSLHKKVLERCGTFSVKELQRQIEARGIKVTCVDDPLSIRALLCLDYPKDALCQFHLTALLK